MGKWMDSATQLDRAAVGHDVSDDRDISLPIVTNVINVTRGLPAAVVAGLAWLPTAPAPRVRQPEVWPRVVADAVRLADEGWAEQALALGWLPLDLWGCSPDIGGNPDHDGLAVWMDGRRVLLLDERTCIVATTATRRSVFTRRDVVGAVLLWDLGRG